MSNGTFTTALFDTATQSPTSLMPAPLAAGNVGVCLSGGGSRAFTAGLGQLLALETLQANGASLLSQISAISTVSGGGWIGIPFSYLPSTYTDAGFLGAYIPPNGLTLSQLNRTPAGIAAEITHSFSVPAIALTALALHWNHGVPWNMVWQTVMGLTFLSPFGLFVPGPNDAPTALFSYDAASLATYVTGPNPSLAAEPAALVAAPAHQRRPYHIGLAGLSVDTATQTNLLVPVQSTPMVTGVLSTPPGTLTTGSNLAVGGGGVSSFAFNSSPTAMAAASATIDQARQWSLTDIIGTSSAAFVELLLQHFNTLKTSPIQFAAELNLHKDEVIQKLSRLNTHIVDTAAWLEGITPSTPAAAAAAPPVVNRPSMAYMMANMPAIEDLIPAYQYWSPTDSNIPDPVPTTYFADGGNLENTGVASMLSYSNITKIIAFVNVETPLTAGVGGAISMDSSIPPLFGYQPCANGTYTPYAGNNVSNANDVFEHCQVFPSSAFAALQLGLWAASGSGQSNGTAIFTQTLTTVANDWFGVEAGREVTLVWVYLQYSKPWHDAITDPLVRLAVDAEVSLFHFPHYNTLLTQLCPIQVQLLSNFTSWVVQAPANSAHFTSLF